MYMKNFCAVVCVTLFLFACSGTPNNVTMSVNQGQCLTGGGDNAPITNPTTAPYCMSVTLQNNNSGMNANNVQVTSVGLTLSYTATATNGAQQSFSNNICDVQASGNVCPSGSTIFGNITVYDPNNCATQQGSKVTTLMAGGGACTFYLQVTAESYAVGQYPIGLTYNYTNANQNYSISQTIYQDVNLYAGGESGVFTYNGESWDVGIANITGNNVTAMINDMYGNLYFSSGTSIYMYNGNATSILGAALPQAVNTINSLAIDTSSNLLVATNNGLYYTNVYSPQSWIQPAGTNVPTNATVLGVAYQSGIVYATESTTVFSCAESTVLGVSLTCTNITNGGPTQFYANSILAESGQLFTGTTTSASTYANSTWSSPYVFTPVLTSGYVSGLELYNSVLYLGVSASIPTTESTLYSCIGVACGPFVSTSGKTVYGNINGITTDGAGYVYAVGQGINSPDFSPTNVASIFLNVGTSGALWQSISGNIGNLNTVNAVSMLTH